MVHNIRNIKTLTGFTLIEVALSIAILAAGSTACIAMFITGLRWTMEAKINATAAITAQAVVATPMILERDSRNTGPFPFTSDAKGWLNTYYIVRTVDNKTTLSNNGGYNCEVEITVYHGGDNTDGEIVYSTKRIMHFRAQ